ncbi:hypothetical protein T440DRAFT_478340 [Plenodomus tracheiphilus IPT5]|uniref:Uncharacterized protein n=1 Tax=Plenodomus tracheiphilus IPT5 TaxID=1408161 RepID=A0A6A7B8N5_9PLEO|nr:hypothetical protein T440DRAFT_478340 [Plenodomus tracheiphilus IPT5]
MLSATEVECLGDPDSTFDHATKNLEKVATTDEWGFQRCIRIKNTIDAWEMKAERESSWIALAVLVHCEYQLLREYAPQGAITRNPFLSHWVETLQRLEKDGLKGVSAATKSYDVKTEPTAQVIAAVRVEWIKKILSGLDSDMSILSAMSPRHLYDTARLSVKKPFKIQPYIQILVEEEIYDKSHLPATSSAPPDSPPKPPTTMTTHTNGYASNESPKTSPYSHTDWKTTLLANLSQNPSTAVHELTRLPLELPHLDFLTKLLTDRTLESHSIDPTPVILSYIQHSLRTIEKMSSPPPTLDTALETLSPTTNGNSAGDSDGVVIIEYGKEAQSRCVKLLLLFIKSLIRKGLVGVEALYFEIQEVCFSRLFRGSFWRKTCGGGCGASLGLHDSKLCGFTPQQDETTMLFCDWGRDRGTLKH